MSVGTLAAVVNSTFIALSPSLDPESEIPAGTTNLTLVVKAEAGLAMIQSGAQYTLRVLLQDVANFVNLANIPFTDFFDNPSPPPTLTTPWVISQAGKDVTFVFPVILSPAAAAGSIYQVRAFLSVGASFDEVSQVNSNFVNVS